MQLLIDTDNETPASLTMIAGILMMMANTEGMAEQAHANLKPGRPAPPPPIGEPIAPPVPPVTPPLPPDAVPAGTDDEGTGIDPAEAFAGGGSNVLPFPTPAGAFVPPPPPAASAGTVVAPSSTSAPAGSQDLDSAGIPWDARIHSETRKKNADGSWRFRRNLDNSVKVAVMAELQGGAPAAASAPTVAPPPPPPASSVQAPPVIVPPPPPAAAAAAVIPPPPPAASTVIPPPPPTAVQPATIPTAPNAGPVTSFKELMTKVNRALSAGQLTQAQLAEACKAAGVDGVTALVAQPMLVPTVDQYLSRWVVAA